MRQKMHSIQCCTVSYPCHGEAAEYGSQSACRFGWREWHIGLCFRLAHQLGCHFQMC